MTTYNRRMAEQCPYCGNVQSAGSLRPADDGDGYRCTECYQNPDVAPLDLFPVRTKTGTAGSIIASTGSRQVLHNDFHPCHNAKQIENPETAKLGIGVVPRTELKRLCKSCGWPDGAQLALERNIRRYR